MNEENDIVILDFPEYEEEFPPLPDIKVRSPLAENKEEVYERNRRIAAEEIAVQRAEERKTKLAAETLSEDEEIPASSAGPIGWILTVLKELGASAKTLGYYFIQGLKELAYYFFADEFRRAVALLIIVFIAMFLEIAFAAP